MDAAPAAVHLDRMPEVQHLVIHKIFNGITRDVWLIENPAHDDCVVRGIVVSEAVTRMIAAPRHLRPSHQPVEETLVEIFKNTLELIVLAGCSRNLFAPPHLSDQMHLGRDCRCSGKFPVPGGMAFIDLRAIKLSNQDVKDSVQDWLRCAFQKIREPDQNASLAQPDGVVEIAEGIEANFKFRQRGSWAKLTINLFEKSGESGIQMPL